MASHDRVVRDAAEALAAEIRTAAVEAGLHPDDLVSAIVAFGEAIKRTRDGARALRKISQSPDLMAQADLAGALEFDMDPNARMLVEGALDALAGKRPEPDAFAVVSDSLRAAANRLERSPKAAARCSCMDRCEGACFYPDMIPAIKKMVEAQLPEDAHDHTAAWVYRVAIDVAKEVYDTEPEADWADQIALEVLCRVFDDGADAGIAEWREFNKSGWMHWSRALGAFIRGRLSANIQRVYHGDEEE